MPALDMVNPSEDTLELMTKNGAVTHAFKLLQVKCLDNQASEIYGDYDSAIDDDIRDIVNNVVLNLEDDP